MSNNKKVRFATIGTGKIVRRFLDAASKCAQLEYCAVYSRTEETARKFAGEYGVTKFYTDLEALACDSEIDGVYIASPNALHCQQAVLLMSHGKHVLCEKPVASNLPEFEQMLKASEDNHVVFFEAMRSVLDPGFAAVQEHLPKLGTIRRAFLQYCQYSSRYDNYKNGIIENAFKPELSNGSLMDIGVYCVHALVKLFGLPEQVEALPIILSNGVDGAGTIIAKYPDMQAELVYSKITDSHLPSEIQGESANMLIWNISNVTRIQIIYRNGQTEEFIIDKESNDMYYEAAEWASLIQNNQSAAHHTRYTEMEMKLMDEARRKMGIQFPADTLA